MKASLYKQEGMGQHPWHHLQQQVLTCNSHMYLVFFPCHQVQQQDKYRQENIAMTLARFGLIDPYNLFEDLGMKNADQRYETLVKFKMSPDSLSDEVRQENQNRMAYIDFACIMNGEDVKGHDDVDA